MGLAQEMGRFMIVLASNFPMGVTGFGDAIVMHIALTFCGMALPGVCSSAISEAVFNLTIGGLAAMLVQFLLIHQHTNWKLVRVLLPPILAGTVFGMIMLYHIHSIYLKRALGLVFLSVACYQIKGEIDRLRRGGFHHSSQVPFDPTPKEITNWGTLAGFFSGVLAGLFGTGGPPLMVFVAVYEIDKDEWRATNSYIWLIDNVLRFCYIFFIQQQISLPADIPDLLSLMVAGGVGVYMGNMVSKIINVSIFRRLIILLLLLGANVMLFAGRSGSSILTGVASVLTGVAVFALALWKGHPMEGFRFDALGIGSSVRWVNDVIYTKVATNEEESEEGVVGVFVEVGEVEEGEEEGESKNTSLRGSPPRRGGRK